jgi:hypothetical protein
MSRRPTWLLTRASWLFAAAVILAGCAHTTRVATLNQVAAGSSVAATLEKQLAANGMPHAHVFCAETILISVGRVNSCRILGTGPRGRVHFVFSNYSGAIKHGSVTAR